MYICTLWYPRDPKGPRNAGHTDEREGARVVEMRSRLVACEKVASMING